jgi:hypothetical protein
MNDNLKYLRNENDQKGRAEEAEMNVEEAAEDEVIEQAETQEKRDEQALKDEE